MVARRKTTQPNTLSFHETLPTTTKTTKPVSVCSKRTHTRRKRNTQDNKEDDTHKTDNETHNETHSTQRQKTKTTLITTMVTHHPPAVVASTNNNKNDNDSSNDTNDRVYDYSKRAANVAGPILPPPVVLPPEIEALSLDLTCFGQVAKGALPDDVFSSTSPLPPLPIGRDLSDSLLRKSVTSSHGLGPIMLGMEFWDFAGPNAAAAAAAGTTGNDDVYMGNADSPVANHGLPPLIYNTIDIQPELKPKTEWLDDLRRVFAGRLERHRRAGAGAGASASTMSTTIASPVPTPVPAPSRQPLARQAKSPPSMPAVASQPATTRASRTKAQRGAAKPRVTKRVTQAKVAKKMPPAAAAKGKGKKATTTGGGKKVVDRKTGPASSSSSKKIKPAAVATTTTTKKKRVLFDENHHEKNYINELKPNHLDVLGGRGGGSNYHPGNVRYWEKILQLRPYHRSCATDDEKTAIACQVVDHIHSGGGRFLLREDGTRKLFILPYDACLEKCKQALRDRYVPLFARQQQQQQQQQEQAEESTAAETSVMEV